jgi:hypothetical protein
MGCAEFVLSLHGGLSFAEDQKVDQHIYLLADVEQAI